MYRLFIFAFLVMISINLVGCRSDEGTKEIPKEDNRPAEVKEVDDGMQKQNELVKKGLKK